MFNLLTQTFLHQKFSVKWVLFEKVLIKFWFNHTVYQNNENCRLLSLAKFEFILHRLLHSILLRFNFTITSYRLNLLPKITAQLQIIQIMHWSIKLRRIFTLISSIQAYSFKAQKSNIQSNNLIFWLSKFCPRKLHATFASEQLPTQNSYQRELLKIASCHLNNRIFVVVYMTV